MVLDTATLMALYREHGGFSLKRVGDKIGVAPSPSPLLGEVLATHKEAFLGVLRDGEELTLGRILQSPYRFAGLLGTVIAKGELVYLEYAGRRYLVPRSNLGPHLVWAENLFPGEAVRAFSTSGDWEVCVEPGWNTIEAPPGGKTWVFRVFFEG